MLVLPIRGKLLKPGFRVVEKKNWKTLFCSGFEMNSILTDKNSNPCEITIVGLGQFISEL